MSSLSSVPVVTPSAELPYGLDEHESLVVPASYEDFPDFSPDISTSNGPGVLSPLQSLIGSARKARSHHGSSSAYAQLSLSEAEEGDAFWEEEDDPNPIETVRRGIGSIVHPNSSAGAGLDKVIVTVDRNASMSPPTRTWKDFFILHQRTILSWISLLLAVISMSSIGPAFKYLEADGIAPSLGT
jgi:hypothetical protein